MHPEAYSLMRETDETHWWYVARREIICQTVLDAIQPGADILDFGCGTGATSSRLRDLGFRVTCADTAEESLSACRDRGLPTIDLRGEWPADASADCVLAADVLEHVADDDGLLNQLRQILRPGGTLVVTVPAFEFLWSGEDHVSQHHRRYTRRALGQRIRSAGFTVRWCSYFNTLLFPIIAAVILVSRVLRPRTMYHSNISQLPRRQNNLLRRIFACERRLLRCVRFPIGASILLIAQLGQRAPTIPIVLGEPRGGPHTAVVPSNGDESAPNTPR